METQSLYSVPKAHAPKKTWRDWLEERRSQLGEQRRKEGEAALIRTLTPMLFKATSVLSFASFRTEISTHALNVLLSQHTRLILPKTTNTTLSLFEISDIKNDLTPNSWGILEPAVKLDNSVSLSEIDVVLVPGLGFDTNYHRLGYGKGYYDRLLSQLSPDVRTFGIGFKEQLVAQLPITANDLSVKELYLF